MPKKTIMIVDDEYLLLESVKEVLEKEHYDIITALSGPDALIVLKKTKIDLILIDIMMPGMNGLELTRKIREKLKPKDLKIAYLSVLPLSKAQKESLKKFKILDYIQKPFDSQDLVKRVSKMVKKSRR